MSTGNSTHRAGTAQPGAAHKETHTTPVQERGLQVGYGDTRQSLLSQLGVTSSHLPLFPALLQTAASQSCARHRGASGCLQPQPCRCCCLRWPRPLLTMCLCNCLWFSPAHRSQHIPAQGLKPAAAGENREWVWGGKGNNLHAQQWSELSELLRSQLIIMDTLEPLFRENVTRCSKRCLQSRTLRPVPREVGWGEVNIPGSSAGLLCLSHISSPFHWAPQSSQAAPDPSWARTCEGQALPAIGDVSCLQPVPGLQGEVLVPHQHGGVEAEDLPKLGVCLCSGHHRAKAVAGLGGRKEDPCSISSLDLPSL